MEVSAARRAVIAANSVAAAFELDVDDAVVLNDSNRLVVRLLPCDIVARVTPIGWFSAAREVDLARRLAEETDAPIAGLDPRVEPCVVMRDGFEISFWSYFDALPSRDVVARDYAYALERLHCAMRRIDMSAPHFTERLEAAQRWLADPAITPDLTIEDREFLVERLAAPRHLRSRSDGAEQLLHGEPHPWNVLMTTAGLLFVDFENCARGPVEYDLAWAPTEVGEQYQSVDPELVGECRSIVLALIAAHRWRRDDQHPSGRQSGEAFLDVLRVGPPWPSLDAVHW